MVRLGFIFGIVPAQGAPNDEDSCEARSAMTVVGSTARPADRAGGTAFLDSAEAWRWIGWFGLILSMAGLGDFVLTWLPVQLGSPEWEFGTIAASFSGLPLVTMGLAAVLGSALARGAGGQALALGVFLIAMALALICALGIFALVVPVALAAVEGVARIGIVKAIVRTTLLGVLFTIGYMVAGISALRRSRTLRSGQQRR